jgi:DNA-binding transcriptional ArsR family regulator
MLKALSRHQLEDALKLAMSGKQKAKARPHATAVNTELDRILSALALRHRLEIIDFLRSGPRTAGEISEAVGMDRANFSRHLKQLSDAGLISIEVSSQDARQRLVSLRKEPFDALKTWMGQFDVTAD